MSRRRGKAEGLSIVCTNKGEHPYPVKLAVVRLEANGHIEVDYVIKRGPNAFRPHRVEDGEILVQPHMTYLFACNRCPLSVPYTEDTLRGLIERTRALSVSVVDLSRRHT